MTNTCLTTHPLYNTYHHHPHYLCHTTVPQQSLLVCCLHPDPRHSYRRHYLTPSHRSPHHI
ncbi:hypothetical protein E2C01_044725 [Portunus trituberculatus]|uniref:Uncharacterized protein n=1 Tax=Portunus trituberculatus TaxID=210409 RepID=A0A5B7FTV7_PORTR|nr:hypothetical protein [Portunus trituberculatus]